MFKEIKKSSYNYNNSTAYKTNLDGFQSTSKM